MGDLEEEVRVLREKNNELVQKVQYWKMTAAQRENEKLDLMKEINQLRLKLSRIRSGGAAQARKLDAALQTASEEALSHLVQASSAVARTIELTKQYIQNCQEVDMSTPRWSNLSNVTPERVNKVPPLLIGGRTIQPVVSLRRASLNATRNNLRSPNQHRNTSERAMPMHMLQDAYIPLTRIDTSNYPVNFNEQTEADDSNVENDSTDNLGLEEDTSQAMEVTNSSDDEEYDNSRRLDAVTEDVEPEDENTSPPQRLWTENPLEGPSWLLDVPRNRQSKMATRPTLEPDSTTELEDNQTHRPNNKQSPTEDHCAGAAQEFTPTVRRRKRTASGSPANTHGDSFHNRVLKVMVAKMQLSPSRSPAPAPAGPAPGPSPAPAPAPRSPAAPPPVKRAAPSPNGATDHRLIVLESPESDMGGGDSFVSTPGSVRRPRPSRDGHRTRDDSRLSAFELSAEGGAQHTRPSQDLSQNSASESVGAVRKSVLDDHRNVTNNDQSVTNRDHSVTNRDQSVTNHDQSVTNHDQSVTNHDQSVTNHDQNVTNRDQNVTNRNQSVSNRNTATELSLVRQARALHISGADPLDARTDTDSDVSERAEPRTRRNRKPVTYKEMPLHRKLRR